MSDSCKPASYDLKVACLRRFQRSQRIGTSVPPFLLRVHREEVGGGVGVGQIPVPLKSEPYPTRGMKLVEESPTPEL